MKMIVALFFSAFFLPVSTALAAEATASNMTLSAPTEVPGMTLQPGTYSIRVVGKLTDRFILKIDDSRGNKSVDFLAFRTVPSRLLPVSSRGVSPSTALRICAGGWLPEPPP